MTFNRDDINISTILIVDTEGTFELRDIGAVLYHLEFGVIKQFSTLIPHQLTEAMVEIKTNGTVDYVHRHAASKYIDDAGIKNAIDILNDMINRCDVILAHSASRDKQLLSTIAGFNLDAKPWICTVRGIEWPNIMDQKHLGIYVKILAFHMRMPTPH